jgi:hypothetical protein
MAGSIVDEFAPLISLLFYMGRADSRRLGDAGEAIHMIICVQRGRSLGR